MPQLDLHPLTLATSGLGALLSDQAVALLTWWQTQGFEFRHRTVLITGGVAGVGSGDGAAVGGPGGAAGDLCPRSR